MIPLPNEHYKIAVEQLKSVKINCLFARSVAEKHVTGNIFVDCFPDPKVFYIVHPYGMSLLLGYLTQNENLKWHLVDCIKGKKSKEWLQVFPISSELFVDDIFLNQPVLNAAKYQRLNFKFNRQKFEQLKSTIEYNGFEFIEISENAFNKIDGMVVPKKFWDNASDFLANGVGFTLLKNKQPVSCAFSAFIHGNKLELGMETLPEARDKGFATIVCSKLIDFCLSNNYEPVWACSSNNKGSFTLASKLGFEVSATLPYYEIN